MRYVLVAVTMTALLVPAGSAAAAAPRKKELRKYSALYYAVKEKHGKRAPGRNIRKYGVRFKWVGAGGKRRHWGTRNARAREISKSIRQLRRLNAPYTSSVPPPRPPSGVMSARVSGGSSNPMVNPSCESGGNPQVVDPSGKYWGWYQFDRQTWVGHGGSPSSYGNAPLAEQHRVASRVGYDAWPNC